MATVRMSRVEFYLDRSCEETLSVDRPWLAGIREGVLVTKDLHGALITAKIKQRYLNQVKPDIIYLSITVSLNGDIDGNICIYSQASGLESVNVETGGHMREITDYHFTSIDDFPETDTIHLRIALVQNNEASQWLNLSDEFRAQVVSDVHNNLRARDEIKNEILSTLSEI